MAVLLRFLAIGSKIMTQMQMRRLLIDGDPRVSFIAVSLNPILVTFG